MNTQIDGIKKEIEFIEGLTTEKMLEYLRYTNAIKHYAGTPSKEQVLGKLTANLRALEASNA